MIARWDGATAIAERVRGGAIRATDVVDAALDRIEREGERYNCFSAVLARSAREEAGHLDARIAAGADVGPLAGVPFAVKNLFDVAGVVTLAGAKINRENPPSTQDAAAVQALRSAGAILVGTLHMDEYAYGFTTENTHFGPARNPYDLTRTPGGSSGGSSACVAAGLVPLSLGTDTGGSIRVPAALCGLFGLKPTFGRISRRGTVLFAPSLDHVGPLTRSARDLALAFEVLNGPDQGDPVSSARVQEKVMPSIGDGIRGMRVARASGYFAERLEPAALAATLKVADALGAGREVEVPHVATARAAATIIPAVEGSALHMENLRKRPQDFDPMTRDRFLAGALLPGSIYARAQAFRRAYRDDVKALFDTLDIIVTPTTPMPAPSIGQSTISIEGETLPSRPHLGRFTLPISFIGLPAITVPVWSDGPLPYGVQLIAAPFQESILFRAAAFLEAEKVVGFVEPS
jgi:AtzE family amidohydrolase